MMTTGAPSRYAEYLAERKAWLLGEWEKCVQRRDSEECPRCHGRGYTRKDERVGCEECLGVGHVEIP